MAKVLAVGGPKGGVGKTTCALNFAIYASRELNLRVLLVDADPNRSSLDAASAAGDHMPFKVAEGFDHDLLVQLQHSTQLDLVVVDLPGAREAGALAALLRGEGDDGAPAVHALVMPTRPEIMDVRALRRQALNEIKPLGLPYMVALVRVHRDRVSAALKRREELRALGLTVAENFTRALVVHDDALEEKKPVMDMPGGKRSITRAADREYRELTIEALQLVDIDASALRILEPEKATQGGK